MASKTKDGIEILNTSQIAMRVGLNRATVRLRLIELGISPVETKAKEHLYEFTDELKEQLTSENKPIDLAKLRRETANAELCEIKLAETKGEMVSVAEFSAVVQQLFGAMNKKCVVQMPKKLAKQLAATRAEADVSKILTAEYGAIFDDLRIDYKKFLDKKSAEIKTG
jgi:hypothetical protein